MAGEKPVQRIGHASSDDPVAEYRAVAPDESPAGVALVFRQRDEEVGCHVIVERDECETMPPIETDDDTRRPAAEASAGVVQEDRTTQRHRALSKPSSVAQTSAPIVSRT